MILSLSLLLLAPLSSPRVATAQTPATPTLKLDQKNVMTVGQKLPIVLGKVIDPRTERELDQKKLRFSTSDKKVLIVEQGQLVALSLSTQPVKLYVRTPTGRSSARTVAIYEIEVVAVRPNPAAKIEYTLDPPGGSVKPGSWLTVAATPLTADNLPADAAVEWAFEDYDARDYVKWVTGTSNEIVLFGLPEAAGGGRRPNRLLLTASSGTIYRKIYVDLEGGPAPASAEPKSQTHEVRGTITLDGKPLSNVTVALREEGVSNALVQRTTDSGAYSFTGLKDGGSYTVEPEFAGHSFSPTSQKLTALGASVVTNFVGTLVTPPVSNNFKPMKAKLEVMDFRTVSYLFGGVTNQQYIVAKVHFFNTLDEMRNGQFMGDSVVIASDSIDAHVNYEIRYVGPKKLGKDSTGRDKKAHPARTDWHPLDLIDKDPSKPLDWSKVKEPTLNECSQQPRRFRPYIYDMVLNTVDRRDSREWRSWMLTGAQAAATMTGYITSFVVPSGSSDLPTALEKFNSLLIPGFKEHFPSTKDSNRRNLTEMIMRPSETVPYKGSVSRVVFFPKESVKGLLPGYEVRISQVCPDFIEVPVSVARTGDKLPINTLAGKITDSAGNPLGGVEVAITDGVFFERRATSTANGSYTFPSLAPGNFTVSVTKNINGCDKTVSKTVSVNGDTAGVDLTLPALFSVSGAVKDAQDKLLQGATVRLTADGKPPLEATTDAEGAYTINCVEPGEYKLTAKKDALKFDPKDKLKVDANKKEDFKAKP